MRNLFSLSRYPLLFIALLAVGLVGSFPLQAVEHAYSSQEQPVVRPLSRPQKPFILHSIPKCGTHLMHRLIWLMTGREIINKGIIDNDALWQAFKAGKVYRLHLEYRPELADTVTQQWKHLIISMVRDPRDALISHAFYMREFEGKGLQRDFFQVAHTYDSLTLEEQISSLITGSEHSPSYLAYYLERAQWSLSGRTHPLYFEDLVGSKGGGKDQAQRRAIRQLADYIGISLSKGEIEQIQERLYQERPDTHQDGKTFERGHQGNWRTFLTDEHKELIKAEYGQLLIDLGYEKDLNW